MGVACPFGACGVAAPQLCPPALPRLLQLPLHHLPMLACLLLLQPLQPARARDERQAGVHFPLGGKVGSPAERAARPRDTPAAFPDGWVYIPQSLQTSHPSYPPIQPVIYLSSIHPLHPSLPSSLLLLPRPLRLALGTALPVEGMQGEPGRDRRSQETAGPAARGEAGGRGAGGRIPSRGGPRGRHRPRGTQ